MRIASVFLLAIVLSGCVVTKPQLIDSYAVTRIDSRKPPAEFAGCVANALRTIIRTERGSTHVIIANDLGVHVARWDFISTGDGSQAELRASPNYDPQTEKVKACA